MTAALIALITALISFFAAKKGGASDGQAALAGAAAGAGSYYVATNTEWGKGAVSSIEKGWDSLFDANGEPLLNGDGTAAKAPAGAEPVLGEDGQPVRDSSGNVLWKLVDSAGNVLTSWGPTGTATVIGTTAIAADDDLREWLPWIAGGVVAIMLLR